MSETVKSIRMSILAASDAVHQVCMLGAQTMLLAMLTLTLIQVVARYIFDSPPQWTEEAARYTMIWAGLLGATTSFKLKVDPVLFQGANASKVALSRASAIARFIAVMLFVAPTLWFSTAFLQRAALRTSESLELNLAAVGAIVPIAFAAIALHAVAALFAPAKKESEPS
jgi:TRAP-type C4-dicarboxylate transport system permease small subunit